MKNWVATPLLLGLTDTGTTPPSFGPTAGIKPHCFSLVSQKSTETSPLSIQDNNKLSQSWSYSTNVIKHFPSIAFNFILA